MLKYTPCLDPDCRKYATRQGRCEDHYMPFYGSTRKQRLPKDWRSRRNAVLVRDKYICYVCNGPGADSVDHISPGDNHAMNNLKAIHSDVEPFCHRYKTAAEGVEARYGRKSNPYAPF